MFPLLMEKQLKQTREALSPLCVTQLTNPSNHQRETEDEVGLWRTLLWGLQTSAGKSQDYISGSLAPGLL